MRYDFASDNTAGICPEAWAALDAANRGPSPPYGDDDWTPYGAINGPTATIQEGPSPCWPSPRYAARDTLDAAARSGHLSPGLPTENPEGPTPKADHSAARGMLAIAAQLDFVSRLLAVVAAIHLRTVLRMKPWLCIGDVA